MLDCTQETDGQDAGRIQRRRRANPAHERSMSAKSRILKREEAHDPTEGCIVDDAHAIIDEVKDGYLSYAPGS
jgi:hypothetical protein